MNHLLVIDDRRIRKAAFAQAEKILKKIDRLEQDLASFGSQDQRLFSNWFDLTFRDEQKRISDLHEEFRRLAIFNNEIIAVARQRRISMAAAFVLLRDEEAQYASGSDAIRVQIEETRREREKFILCLAEKESGRDSAAEGCSELDDDEFAENPVKETEEESRANDEEALRTIREMSDKEIRKICKDTYDAFDILETIFSFIRSDEERVLFLRVWDLVPTKTQVAFADEMAAVNGISVTRLIEAMRDKIAGGQSNCTGGYDEGRREEQLKITYRMIVRLLHPDRDSSQNVQAAWRKQIWHRAQEAYQRRDGSTLEKLHRLILLRDRALTELKVSEILDSQVWLNEELEDLKWQAKQLRRLPAWGFSRRTDYAPLIKKLEKPFYIQFAEFDDQVRKLKAHHAYLERIARFEVPDRVNAARNVMRRKLESSGEQNGLLP